MTKSACVWLKNRIQLTHVATGQLLGIINHVSFKLIIARAYIPADRNFHIFFFAVLQIIFIARDCYRTFILDNLDRNLETPRTRDR